MAMACFKGGVTMDMDTRMAWNLFCSCLPVEVFYGRLTV
uniref:Uncharacterized protein n=1 Tax=Tetranychus urticae TaxID=32264 RepID=T1JXZ8_TETUR